MLGQEVEQQPAQRTGMPGRDRVMRSAGQHLDAGIRQPLASPARDAADVMRLAPFGQDNQGGDSEGAEPLDRRLAGADYLGAGKSRRQARQAQPRRADGRAGLTGAPPVSHRISASCRAAVGRASTGTAWSR